MFQNLLPRKRKIQISKNQINLGATVVDYTLRLNPRSKSVRLAIHVGGEFIVTAPPRVPQKMIEHFILQKSEWVLEKIEKQKKNHKLPIVRKTKAQQKAEYLKYKNQALQVATEKVQYWNSFYNFKFNKISIKNQKTRWGSCSRKGNLNFSYKIALLPERLADYLVVHELSHLGEFNHSKKFWALVLRTIPDYKIVRNELKKNNGIVI